MAYTSSNSIKTNELVDLVCLRGAQVAHWLLAGSKAHFQADMQNKKNGVKYSFVLRDTGNVANSVTMDSSKNSIVEKTVQLCLEPWNIGVKTNAIEGITDIHTFDREIAEPNAQKLLNAAVSKSIKKNMGKVTTAWVGRGFTPLAKASAHLSSITSEELFSFVDPMIHALTTSMGAVYASTGAPSELWKTGLLGIYHGATYFSQRFLKSVTIPEALVNAIGSTGKVNTYTPGTDYDTIKIDFGTAAASAFKVQAGSVFWIDGLVACDLVGDPTTAPLALVPLEDVDVAAGATDVTIKVDPVTFDLGGTRDACKEDGSSWTPETLANALVSVPEAGKYFAGYMRANGAMTFQSLDRLDVSNSDSEIGKVENITIHKNRVIDLANFENITRFDLVELSGIVEKRANTYMLVK